MFGTHKTTKAAIQKALSNGFSWLDTATGYQNTAVIRDALLPQQKDGVILPGVSLLTKFNSGDFQDVKTIPTYLEQLPLVPAICLLHSPSKDIKGNWSPDETLNHFQAMKTAVAHFKPVLGVSNFSIDQLSFLLDQKCPVQHVQLEWSPYYQPRKLLQYCLDRKIEVSGYRLTHQGDIFKDESLKTMASKYKVSILQLVQAWSRKHGIM